MNLGSQMGHSVGFACQEWVKGIVFLLLTFFEELHTHALAFCNFPSLRNVFRSTCIPTGFSDTVSAKLIFNTEMHADICSICLFVLLICLSHWNSVYNFLVILKLTLSKRGRTNVNDLKVLILTLLLIDFTFDN